MMEKPFKSIRIPIGFHSLHILWFFHNYSHGQIFQPTKIFLKKMTKTTYYFNKIKQFDIFNILELMKSLFFIDIFQGDTFEEFRKKLNPMRSIDHAGEVAEYMMILTLNELGKSFLKVDNFVSQNRPYANARPTGEYL